VGKALFTYSKNDIWLCIMRDIDLFQMAIGLTPPWQVSDAEFNPTTQNLITMIYLIGGKLNFGLPT